MKVRARVDWMNLWVALITISVCMGILAVGSTDRLRHDNWRSAGLILCFLWTIIMGGYVAGTLDKAREKDTTEREERERL